MIRAELTMNKQNREIGGAGRPIRVLPAEMKLTHDRVNNLTVAKDDKETRQRNEPIGDVQLTRWRSEVE